MDTHLAFFEVNVLPLQRHHFATSQASFPTQQDEQESLPIKVPGGLDESFERLEIVELRRGFWNRQ